jgi:hypothetical protein
VEHADGQFQFVYLFTSVLGASSSVWCGNVSVRKVEICHRKNNIPRPSSLPVGIVSKFRSLYKSSSVGSRSSVLSKTTSTRDGARGLELGSVSPPSLPLSRGVIMPEWSTALMSHRTGVRCDGEGEWRSSSRRSPPE